MTLENTTFGPRIDAPPSAGDLYQRFQLPTAFRRVGTRGLSGHVRQLRRKNQGISRWLLFAVLGGVVVAIAMVQYGIL
jgi:hypothetical protein